MGRGERQGYGDKPTGDRKTPGIDERDEADHWRGSEKEAEPSESPTRRRVKIGEEDPDEQEQERWAQVVRMDASDEKRITREIGARKGEMGRGND